MHSRSTAVMQIGLRVCRWLHEWDWDISKHASQLFGVVLVNKFPSHTTKTNAGYKRALSHHEIHAAFQESSLARKRVRFRLLCSLYIDRPLHYFCVYLSSTLCCCRHSVANKTMQLYIKYVFHSGVVELCSARAGLVEAFIHAKGALALAE